MDISKLGTRLPNLAPSDLHSAKTTEKGAVADAAASGAARATPVAKGPVDSFERAAPSASPFSPSSPSPAMGVEALIGRVLHESAKDATADLRDLMTSIRGLNQNKQALRERVGEMKADAARSLSDGQMVMTTKGYGLQLKADLAVVTSPNGKALQVSADPRTTLAPLALEPKRLPELVDAFGVLTAASEATKAPPKKADLDARKDGVKEELDSLSDMGDIQSLRLQQAMDQMSKVMSTLSNLLKKLSDTATSITQNLK